MDLTKNITVKGHFYADDRFIQIYQNRPLDRFYVGVLALYVWHDKKIYAVQIYM